MEEFEKAEKGKSDMTLSYGLEDPEDRSFTNWNAMVMGPYNTKFDQLYSIKIVCGPNYPMQHPTLQFVSKVIGVIQINLACVNMNNGMVDKTKFAAMRNWNKDNTIETLLLSLKDEMSRSTKLPQPAEGSNF